MTTPMIVQFVGFATSLDTDAFASDWENYTEKLKKSATAITLYKQKNKLKKGFDFITKIEWPQNDFDSTLANGQKPGRFSENKSRAVPLGGYLVAEEQKRSIVSNNETIIIALVANNETDIDKYSQLPLYSEAIIYQAFYENCSNGFIIEYTVSEDDADALLHHLSKLPGVDASIYRECLQPQV